MTRRLFSPFFQRECIAVLMLVFLASSNLLLQQSFAETTITLDTTKGSYGPGDVVSVKGNVADSPNKLVAVQVKDPSGATLLVRTVKTDADGNFVLTFKLPSTAKAGSYDIAANTSVNGSTVSQAKSISTTVTVPEFSSAAPIILVISVISILALSAKSRLLKN